MEPIVQEVSEKSLLAASVEHLVAYVLHCGRAPGGEVHETPELVWAICGVHSSWMNGVVRTHLPPEANVDTAIHFVLERAKERGLPFGWFIPPDSHPANLGERLEAHGMKFEDHEPAMTVPLDGLLESAPVREGLRVVEVLDEAMLEQWAETWGVSYEASWQSVRSRFELRAAQGLGPARPYRSYLAFLDDQPVATSELFLGAGVASVVWVGTVPTARRMGIGAAMVVVPLQEARRLGYRIGALTSSNAGYAVYRQLGFREMCRISHYSWSPEEN